MWIEKSQTYLFWAPAIFALTLLRASANAIESANETTSYVNKSLGTDSEPCSISDTDFNRMEGQMLDLFPLNIEPASPEANHSESFSPSQLALNKRTITSHLLEPRQTPEAASEKTSTSKPVGVKSSGNKKPEPSPIQPSQNRMRYNFNTTRIPLVGQITAPTNFQMNSTTGSKSGVSSVEKIPLFRQGKPASPNGEGSPKPQPSAAKSTSPQSNISPKPSSLKPRQTPNSATGKALTSKPIVSSSNGKTLTTSISEPSQNRMRYNINSTRLSSVDQVVPTGNNQSNSTIRLKGSSSVSSSRLSAATQIPSFQHGKPTSATGAVSSKSLIRSSAILISSPTPRPSRSSTSSGATRTNFSQNPTATKSASGVLKSSSPQTSTKPVPTTSTSSYKPLTTTSLILKPTISSTNKPVISSSQSPTKPITSIRPVSSSSVRSSSTTSSSSKIFPSTVSSSKATSTSARLTASIVPPQRTSTQSQGTVVPFSKSSVNKVSSSPLPSTTSKSVPKATSSILLLPTTTSKSVPKATSSILPLTSTTSKSVPKHTSSIVPLPSTTSKSVPKPTSSIVPLPLTTSQSTLKPSSSSSPSLPKTSTEVLPSSIPNAFKKPTNTSNIIITYHNTSVTRRRGSQDGYINPGSFLASSTNYIPTRINLSNQTSQIKTTYTTGLEPNSTTGSFDKSFGEGGLTTKWQSSGELSKGGCDVSLVGVELIKDCYRMSLSGEDGKHLGNGDYATARQRIEVYVAGVVDSSTWEYSWKAFLATSTTTNTFFHLWQLLTRGGNGLSGPVVTLEALNGKAIVKDVVRCADGCTSVDIDQFSHRLIQHQMIVKYGNEGKIEYQAIDSLSGINLLTYNASGFMGNVSTSIKFGLYRRSNSEMGPAT
ncbi:hypothetical protein DFH28DRAFT_1120504 [Melampsora americana]|nr:hypothetical protein DFH28DRAFT_1120504 [Melampsora americana]